MEPPLSVETLIPHRDRMKLLDEIVEVTSELAVARAVVSKRWPLFSGGGVDPLVLIEVVAQTAAAHISWKTRAYKEDPSGGGLLTGIKSADFFENRILEDTVLTATVQPLYSVDNYTVLEGAVTTGGRTLGRVVIQAIHYVQNEKQEGMTI